MACHTPFTRPAVPNVHVAEHLVDLWGDQVCESCSGEDAAEILDRQADMLRRAETVPQTREGLELIKSKVEQMLMLLTLKKGEQG